MAEIQPKCCLPSRKMMTKTFVSNTYALEKKQIKIALGNSVSPIAATTDIWTSGPKSSFLSVIAHYIAWQKGMLQQNMLMLAYMNLKKESQITQILLESIQTQQRDWTDRQTVCFYFPLTKAHD